MKQIAVTAVETDPIYPHLLELLKKFLGTGGSHTMSDVPDRMPPVVKPKPPLIETFNELSKFREVEALWDELAASPDARRYLKLIAAHCEKTGENTFSFDDLFRAWGEAPDTMYAANRRVGKAIKKVLGSDRSPFAKTWNAGRGRMEFTVAPLYLEGLPGMAD